MMRNDFESINELAQKDLSQAERERAKGIKIDG
jgi:hypothetical protein